MTRLRAFSAALRRTAAKHATLRQLGEDSSAVAFVEFAFSAPIVLALGLMGAETANFAITHMQISQIAMQVADNASRIGNSELQERKVYESDVNSTFVGAEKLGKRYSIFENGRIIVSSLQRNSEGGQWIAWQRCRGAKKHSSSYGVQGDGKTGTSFKGMGESSNLITASPGTAVMFVEVSYTYDPITPFDFVGERNLKYTAAFNIRDSRDLTKIHQHPTEPAPIASCSKFSADRPA